MLFVVLPLSIVVFSVVPAELSLPITHSVIEMAFIYTFLSNFSPIFLLVIHELTFELTFLSNVNAFSMSQLSTLGACCALSNVDSVSEPYYAEVGLQQNVFKVECRIKRLIRVDEGRQGVFVRQVYRLFSFPCERAKLLMASSPLPV